MVSSPTAAPRDLRAPLHALQGFVAVAQAGSLTGAAAALHLTVSALSHQIAALERRLDRRLFERGPRGMHPTADGQRLLQQVAPHLAAIEQALRPLAARRDHVLTLSVVPSLASAWLLPRLPGFAAANPQLDLNLLSDAALVDFARAGDVDAALRSGGGAWPGVIAEHLFDEWLAPVASPALVARMRRTGAGTGDLARWPLLGDPDPEAWPQWFARHGGTVPARFAARFDDAEALHRAAAAGMGVALGRLTRVRLLLESRQLQRLGRKRLRTGYAHYLVYPPHRQAHAGLRAFREWLHGEARRHAAASGSRGAAAH
ncbi:LysR substrate-binding domain-containing protein [Luteimonas sp. RD2P54]|uniref:LysR substrate-binding domain-containing protein n=1 Tax=Luteimonas endophytica TaxID=3042023 RepID=A0ABT6J6Y2_9GAMM|nr:LysR substrate-binding domain-containing protein [Luteimonas endophytica]MDH5822580.1 LysR substrate-binding domain-containing protein [Luteimonas endophytica]